MLHSSKVSQPSHPVVVGSSSSRGVFSWSSVHFVLKFVGSFRFFAERKKKFRQCWFAFQGCASSAVFLLLQVQWFLLMRTFQVKHFDRFEVLNEKEEIRRQLSVQKKQKQQQQRQQQERSKNLPPNQIAGNDENPQIKHVYPQMKYLFNSLILTLAI